MKIVLKRRDVLGRKVKNMRSENLIPANIYGPKRESSNVVVDYKEFAKVFNKAGYSSLVQADIEGESEKPKVLIKDVQINPVSGDVIHVSFYQVDMTKPINADVPIIVKGLSPAVKSNVGLLVTPVNVVQVRCLPGDLPHDYTIDSSNLKDIGESFKILDLVLGNGVELASGVSEEQVLAYIAPPQKRLIEEETPEGEEGKEGEEAEGEEKKEGEEAPKGE